MDVLAHACLRPSIHAPSGYACLYNAIACGPQAGSGRFARGDGRRMAQECEFPLDRVCGDALDR